MGASRRVLKASLGSVLVVGFICFLFVGILTNQATKTVSITIPYTGNFKLWKLIGAKRDSVHRDFGLNFVSKRRVPNGPNPIHNRRAGKYRQPPNRD